ncbi:MAG: hypothetical protein NTV82_18980 [Candidatus Aminicenantes bacterium]|nr:hypothetical protein [Candidatus Aminicenantes bacterium]
MIPMIMKMRVYEEGKRPFRFFFPVILIWIIVAALMIVLLPLVLIAALVTWRNGPGKLLLISYPIFFTALFQLSGLHIEIGNLKRELLIHFE